MRYGIFKIMVFPYISYCGGKPCTPQYKMYGITMILKMAYLIIYMSDLVKFLRTTVDLHTY